MAAGGKRPADGSGAEQGDLADHHRAPGRLGSASIEQPTDGAELDLAVLERQAERELGEWAARWECRLPKDSPVRQAASRLRILADPERRQAA